MFVWMCVEEANSLLLCSSVHANIKLVRNYNMAVRLNSAATLLPCYATILHLLWEFPLICINLSCGCSCVAIAHVFITDQLGTVALENPANFVALASSLWSAINWKPQEKQTSGICSPRTLFHLKNDSEVFRRLQEGELQVLKC